MAPCFIWYTAASFHTTTRCCSGRAVVCAQLRASLPTSQRMSNDAAKLFHRAASGWSCDSRMRVEISQNKMYVRAVSVWTGHVQ